MEVSKFDVNQAVDRVASSAHEAVEKASDVAAQVAGKAVDMANQAAEKASDVASRAADKASDVAAQVAEKVSERKKELTNAQEDLTETVRLYVHQNPVKALAIAAVGGFVLSRVLGTRN